MGPNYRRKDPNCTGVDSGQLVHISYCVLVPHAGHQCCTCGRRHPGWLLLLRHHLQVWCGNCDLPDRLREVQQGGPLASLKRYASQSRWRVKSSFIEGPNMYWMYYFRYFALGICEESYIFLAWSRCWLTGHLIQACVQL